MASCQFLMWRHFRYSCCMRAWIVRAGKGGEREEWALTNGIAGGGFIEVADLTSAVTRDDVKALVSDASPGKPAGAINNLAAQLWAMRERISDGDIIVMPRKHTGTIALGYAKGGYRYRDGDDPSRRHAIGVDWVTEDLPRSAVKQDLLYSLGAFLTVCEVSTLIWLARKPMKLGRGRGLGTQSAIRWPSHMRPHPPQTGMFASRTSTGRRLIQPCTPPCVDSSPSSNCRPISERIPTHSFVGQGSQPKAEPRVPSRRRSRF